MGTTKAHTKYKLSDGTVVPGVTTVLNQLGWNKNALMAWARKTAMEGLDPNKVRDQAAEVGTIVHEMISAFLKKKELNLAIYSADDINKARIAFDGFITWWNSAKLHYEFSEIKIVSDKYKFGGTLDLIARNNGTRCLIDFKTSNGIYPEYKVQVAAYKKLADQAEMPIDQCYLLHISKENGTITTMILNDKVLRSGWKVFQHALALYNLQKEME